MDPKFIFFAFVGAVLGLSFYLGKKAKSSAGFFAAGGQIHWGVNGIAFAGDYLSAASFLGICGMIATKGYDGFLYSIGYLAGWIVALFVVAEPMKRLGKYTFTDALDSKFNSKGIQLAAAISTLIVSIFYLIPQMVGAGDLVEPLLGLPHHLGVIIVGGVVIGIVATAGMASTTYVQFIKGGLLVIFSLIITISMLSRGLTTRPDGGQLPFERRVVADARWVNGELTGVSLSGTWLPLVSAPKCNERFVKLSDTGSDCGYSWRMVECQFTIPTVKGELAKRLETPTVELRAIPWQTETLEDGVKTIYISGKKKTDPNEMLKGGRLLKIEGNADANTGGVGPFAFLSKIGHKDTEVETWKAHKVLDGKTTVCTPLVYAGNRVMRPGILYKVEGKPLERLDFVSLMLALFFGTASLPHILIRYYTVPSPAAARKSTIVAIASIGFFYVLSMYMGLGAMVNGVVNPISDNMSAPLLALSFGAVLFAIISSIAFATVLGTVSGLIVASSGAVAHDLMDRYFGMAMEEKKKVMAGKLAAVGVGIIAIILGIAFHSVNVSFLVGWAFSVAASANLPAIIMMLFWKKTTAKGIVASIIAGIVVAIGLILMSPSMVLRYVEWGFAQPGAQAWIPFNNPGIFSIPFSFLVLVVVSLMTQKKPTDAPAPATPAA